MIELESSPIVELARRRKRKGKCWRPLARDPKMLTPALDERVGLKSPIQIEHFCVAGTLPGMGSAEVDYKLSSGIMLAP